MVTEVTAQDIAPREDPREVGQEYATGTIDVDGTGAGSLTVSLSGELSERGLGLLANATSDDGTATTSALSPGSVTIDVSGATADSTVTVEVVVSEDGFAL